MSRIGSDLQRFIRQNFPVARRRSALWFFSNEIRNSTNDESAKRINRNKILMLWRSMEPESKRKYFNMAELDDIRFKEQKSLWVSEIGSSLMRQDSSLKKLSDLGPSHDQLQMEFLKSLEKLQMSYDCMIQAESTKTLYKDTVKRVDNNEHCLDTDRLISIIPKQHRPILAQPRRPPTAFVLFLNDNMERYKQIRQRKESSETCMRLAGLEWAKLDAETKASYDRRYAELRDQYNQAMIEYRDNLISNESGKLIEQATREKRAFKKSLRKRLRDASILPLSIRNAFNFFLMDHKEIKLTDLTEVWRNLPKEQKMKYFEMSRADVIRYQSQIEAYRDINKGLNDILRKAKTVPKPCDESPSDATSKPHEAQSTK